MPLTPNGKVDKNALPFPDTALFIGTSGSTVDDNLKMTVTEEAVHKIFCSLLSLPSVGLDDNFFDIGGHSILATRLIFEIRKNLAVDAPLGLVFKEPSIRGIAAEVEKLLGIDLNIVGKPPHFRAKSGDSMLKKRIQVPDKVANEGELDEVDYAADLSTLDNMVKSETAKNALPPFTFDLHRKDTPIFFLTGATGFLGAFILESLLLKFPKCTVYCLVRSKSVEDAMKRLQHNCEAHGVWRSDWIDRVIAVSGDLALDRFGINEKIWSQLCADVDAIIHNGAMVSYYYYFYSLFEELLFNLLYNDN